MFNPAVKKSHLFYAEDGFITLMGACIGTTTLDIGFVVVYNVYFGEKQYITTDCVRKYRFLRYV